MSILAEVRVVMKGAMKETLMAEASEDKLVSSSDS